ncbi:MAG: hypothetical protein MR792_03855, partial [Paraprevotella sp.]|nr:hypothetical protein [Paraprevotella sp.]
HEFLFVVMPQFVYYARREVKSFHQQSRYNNFVLSPTKLHNFIHPLKSSTIRLIVSSSLSPLIPVCFHLISNTFLTLTFCFITKRSLDFYVLEKIDPSKRKGNLSETQPVIGMETLMTDLDQ